MTWHKENGRRRGTLSDPVNPSSSSLSGVWHFVEQLTGARQWCYPVAAIAGERWQTHTSALGAAGLAFGDLAASRSTRAPANSELGRRCVRTGEGRARTASGRPATRRCCTRPRKHRRPGPAALATTRGGGGFSWGRLRWEVAELRLDENGARELDEPCSVKVYSLYNGPTGGAFIPRLRRVRTASGWPCSRTGCAGRSRPLPPTSAALRRLPTGMEVAAACGLEQRRLLEDGHGAGRSKSCHGGRGAQVVRPARATAG